MKAVLIPSINSAKIYYLNRKNYGKCILCTNSSSVKIYCEYSLKISCIDINEYFDSSKRNFYYFKLLTKYLNDLKKLDSNIKKKLDKREKKYINNWFFHLYRYTPFFYYYALFNFKNSLINFLKKKKVKKLIIFKDFISNHFLFSNDDIEKIIISLNFKNIKIINTKNFQNKYSITDLKIKIKNFIKFFIDKSKNFNFFFKKNFFERKKNILILNPLYEVDLNKFKKNNFYFLNYKNFNYRKDISLESSKKINFNLLKIKKAESIEYQIIIDKIIEHFKNNYKSFLISITKFSFFIKINGFIKLIWGLPPIHPDIKVLMIKYLQQINIPVIGFQHGGCYSDMSQDSLHFLSDYHYCDYFHSYKHKKLLFNKKIKNKLESSKFINSGSYKIKKIYNSGSYSKTNQKQILFPISNWNDNFAHNMGMSSYEVTNRQCLILKILNKLNLNVIIKLISNTNDHYNETCYPGYYLSKYLKSKNFKLEKKLSLQNAINFYQPDLVILEAISTPLYETIINDCDVICYDSKFNKLKTSARKKLIKRVHIAQTDQELIRLIKMYSQGILKKKRSDLFLKENLLNN